MSKALIQIQQNIKNLREEITDLFHLSFLNHQSYLCLNSHKNLPFNQISSNISSQIPNSQSQKSNFPSKSKQLSLTQIHSNIEKELKQLSQIFDKRTENHLNYLIIKQIQGEQECVRRDRLNEYEQKIYDQRRLISDKQVFYQSLLRPKKQRPQFMTSQEFQQLRAMQKVEQEKVKLNGLQQEIKGLQNFRKKITQTQSKGNKRVSDATIIKRQIQLYTKQKNQDLQKTKSNSLETVNLSLMNNMTTVQKPEKQFEEQDLNTVLTTLPPQEELKKMQSDKHQTNQQSQSVSQKCLTKESKVTNGLYLIQIQKLIKNYEKNVSQQQATQKFQKIKSMLHKINAKKEQNQTKRKQLKELQLQNAHMKAHLKKTKQNYKNTNV